VLVRSQVIDDPVPGVAVDHVRIEPARAPRLEGSNPRDRLAAESIDEGVVLDRERDAPSRLREHDAPPAAQAEERLGVEPAFPDLVHHASSDRRDAVGTGEAKASLDLRVEPLKVGSKHALVD
jgi:hypothetical protein